MSNASNGSAYDFFFLKIKPSDFRSVNSDSNVKKSTQ